MQLGNATIVCDIIKRYQCMEARINNDPTKMREIQFEQMKNKEADKIISPHLTYVGHRIQWTLRIFSGGSS